MAISEIVIVGGGCYGTFYARQLERAQARGALKVERVLVVDRDPNCQVARELPTSPTRELVISDWDGFFDEYLGAPSSSFLVPPLLSPSPFLLSPDRPHPLSPSPPCGEGERQAYVVPSPLMPHLMFNWVMRRARALFPAQEVRQLPLTEPVGTPYDTLAPDGTRYVSWADWLCPTHCVEPATCPIIRAPRTWEMADTVRDLVERMGRAGERAIAGPALFITKHLTDGVGAFPVSAAHDAERMLREAVPLDRPASLVVATVSACHGAVGVVGVG